MRIGTAPAPARYQRVDLVEEDDAGRSLSRLTENFAHRLLRFADVLRKQFRAFDGNEVDARFAGNGFGKERLPATGRSREQNAFRRTNPRLGEEAGIFERPLDRFDQPGLGLGEPSDILPAYVGDFDKHLTHRRRLDGLQRREEVVHLDFQLGQLVVGDARQAKVHVGHDAAQTEHGRFAAQRLQVRPDKAVGDVAEAHQIDFFLERHAAAVNLQDLAASVPVGNRNGYLAVKTPRTAQGGIEHVRKIGGANHDHLVPFRQPVHQRQQLRDHPLLHFADNLVAAGRDGIEFVEKDNARRLASSLLENLAQVGFAFAIKLVDHFRSAHGKEIRLRLVRDGARDQRLAASRRPVEQHALGRVDAQPLENFGVTQRQLDHLPDSDQVRPQPANVLVGNRPLGHRLRLKFRDQ